jgi:hypothetical protein
LWWLSGALPLWRGESRPSKEDVDDDMAREVLASCELKVSLDIMADFETAEKVTVRECMTRLPPSERGKVRAKKTRASVLRALNRRRAELRRPIFVCPRVPLWMDVWRWMCGEEADVPDARDAVGGALEALSQMLLGGLPNAGRGVVSDVHRNFAALTLAELEGGVPMLLHAVLAMYNYNLRSYAHP